MTKQEIFNKVWQHFIVEKHPRAMSACGCCYRSPEGHKCAVGLFIPDELYTPGMEGCTFDSLMRYYAFLRDLPVFNVFPLSFWMELQRAHDLGDTPQAFETLLRDVAKNYNLTIPGETK